MLMAVFLSNVPEAIAATTGLGAGGAAGAHHGLMAAHRRGLRWASLAGLVVLANASNATQAFINMFAGGAILAMLADTMIPEALEHGELAGLVNVMGFALAAISLPYPEQLTPPGLSAAGALAAGCGQILGAPVVSSTSPNGWPPRPVSPGRRHARQRLALDWLKEAL